MNQEKAKIVKCDMPKSIILNICKNCKRAGDIEDGETVETYEPKKKKIGEYECDGYINVNQGNLF